METFETLASIFFLRVPISRWMMRSSSCLDLDSPIALRSSKNSLERCIPDMIDVLVEYQNVLE